MGNDPYQVVLRPAAQRDLHKIPEPYYGKIIAILNRLKTVARPGNVKKLKGQENEWRLRTGDYRILYEINDSEKKS